MQNYIYIYMYIYNTVASGRGNAGTFPPPPKSEKLLQKSGVIFQRSILSQRSQKSKKYLVKNCEKSQFSLEILIKKSQNFLEIFQNSFHFWSKPAKFCMQVAQFQLPIEIIHQILMILHFSTNFSRFSPKISRIFMPFSIVLHPSYFLVFS